MERLKVKIQPLFVLYIFLCIYFGWYNDIFYYVVVLTLHEYGHYYMTKHLGYSVEGILFSVYGTSLKTSNNYSIKDEIKIAIAGPMVNVILIVCTIAIWWLFPSMYLFTKSFVLCNIIVLIFNLLPIYPLDGGRVLLSSLSKRFNRNRLEKISSKVCLVIGIMLLVLFIYSLFIKTNYNLFIMGLFMVLNSTLSGRDLYKNTIDVFTKDYKTPVEIKVFKVRDLESSQLVKYLSKNYYSIFEVENTDGCRRVEEKDLFR